MTVVDPNDDSVDRWVILHYGYDNTRREWRTHALEAFDDESECDASIKMLSQKLDEEVKNGLKDCREEFSVALWPRGRNADIARSRIVRKAAQKGVALSSDWYDHDLTARAQRIDDN